MGLRPGTWEQAVKEVRKYYAGTQYNDLWKRMANAKELTPAEIKAMQNVPFVRTVKSNSGNILTWEYYNPLETAEDYAGSINSNAQTAAYGKGSLTTRINGSATKTANKTTMASGAKKVATGTRVASVANKALAATVMVSASTWLAKTIDSALYSANPDWWDEHAPTINPQTWDSIATTEGGKNFINTLFGIEDDDSAQMYIPEEALAMAYMTLYANGGYSQGDITAEYTSTAFDPSPIPRSISLCPSNYHFTMQGTSGVYREFYFVGAQYIACVQGANGSDMRVLPFSTSPNITTYIKTSPGDPFNAITTTSSLTTHGGRTVYYYPSLNLAGNYFHNDFGYYGIPHSVSATNGIPVENVATVIFDGTVTTQNPLDGVSDDPDGEGVDPSVLTADTPAGVLEQMRQNYPNLFDGEIQDDVLQDDGTIIGRKYIPTPYTVNREQPTTGTQKQSNPKVDPDNSTETELEDAYNEIVTSPTSPTAPDTGSGDSPTVVPSTGSASSLWAIYNPTQAEIDSFGSWLWSSNLVDQIKKLFSDPMQAIIGVHKVFATPSTGAAQTIKVGYLDSGVSSAVVTNQYTTIDCGSVNLREYYGNVLDYSPYTEVSLYLPFIGIVRLDTADVMRSSISVTYHVDVLTGACLADVKVTRDAAGGVLYQYAGSAIVTYPVSSGSYVGAVAGVLGIAGGIAGTVLSGGALAPALMGGALGASHLHADVQHSGGFSGAAGAMGGKKPYLIISRAQGATPDLSDIKGTPTTKRVTLGSCSGYTVIDQVNLDGIPATSGELSEIESLLKQGVIV